MSKALLQSETDRLVQDYLSNGGVIVQVPAGRKTVKTFSVSGSVANKGAKAINLRNSGYYKR